MGSAKAWWGLTCVGGADSTDEIGFGTCRREMEKAFGVDKEGMVATQGVIKALECLKQRYWQEADETEGGRMPRPQIICRSQEAVDKIIYGSAIDPVESRRGSVNHYAESNGWIGWTAA